MKWIFSASLILNGVLVFYFVKVNQNIVPKYEKVIVETHLPAETDEIKTSLAAPTSILPGDLEQNEDMNDTHQKMETTRTNFLKADLGLSSKTINEYQRIRIEYFEKTSQMWKQDPYGEMNFSQKRELLDLEENLHKDVSALLGKANWDRYRDFRENYNKHGFEKQIEENRPFLFMGL